MAAIVAIVVPAGRDAAVISRILAAADIACLVIVPDALVRGIATCDMDAALLPEASLPAQRATDLLGALERQPPWSDLPFLVPTGKGPLPADDTAIIGLRGHVTQLERPVTPMTLVRAVRAMLRARPPA